MAESLAWIDALSVTTQLNSGNYKALMGRTGILATPQTFIEQAIPLQPGAVVRQVLPQVATPLLPVLITAASDSALIVAYRALRNAMNPLRGPGILQYTAADGTVRQLNCYLHAGLEGNESIGNRAVGWILVPLLFRAQDPFWYDQNTTVVNKNSGSMGSFVVTNNGDYDFWPVWTVHGPGSNLVLSNTTSGKSLSLGMTLGSSDVLVIDTTPGVKSLVLNGSTNEFGNLNLPSTLWSVPMDANTITATMGGMTGASLLTLTYKQRWLGV